MHRLMTALGVASLLSLSRGQRQWSALPVQITQCTSQGTRHLPQPLGNGRNVLAA